MIVQRFVCMRFKQEYKVWDPCWRQSKSDNEVPNQGDDQQNPNITEC